MRQTSVSVVKPIGSSLHVFLYDPVRLRSVMMMSVLIMIGNKEIIYNAFLEKSLLGVFVLHYLPSLLLLATGKKEDIRI